MIEPVLRTYIASDGYRIHFRQWNAATPKGIIIALHGIQSHSGWYEFSSRRLADAGYTVCFADRRGSGLNGADRGHAAHGLRLINDVRALTHLIQDEHRPAGHAELPVTLLGLSWGAKIAAATMAMFPDEYQRLVLLYPGLEPRIRPNWWQRFRLNLARRFEVTKRHIPIPLSDPALFTSDREWQQFIANDPLAVQTVTSSLLNSGLDLDEIIQTHPDRISCPILLMLAGQDAIIDNRKVLTRVTSFGSSSLLIRNYPTARHTLEFESIREQFVNHLVEWLEQGSGK